MRKFFVILLVLGCIIVQGFASVKFLLYLTHPLKYEAEILNYSSKNDLSPILVASIINVESSFKKNAKSKAGAVGLMQIMPSTASYIAEITNTDYNTQTLYNVEVNIKIGCLYLNYLIEKFRNINTALCAYNAGETTVKNWLKDPYYSTDQITLRVIPYPETREYIKKIKNNLKIYKNYKILK